MQTPQLSLFEIDAETEDVIGEWGTFKDSLRAPIHNWFTYPAGFSYRAVEASLKAHAISAGHTIYDPFMGSGTTNVVAKSLAVNSFGVEAHPFVYRIAQTKLNWAVSHADVETALLEIDRKVTSSRRRNGHPLENELTQCFPELVLKCYEPKTLADLLLIREAIAGGGYSVEVTNFLLVALTAILRQVSVAATGWPYIAPKKQKTTSLNKDALVEFCRQSRRMISDIEIAISVSDPLWKTSSHDIYNADSRDTANLIETAAVDHVFTSPPYLNNFDYADRTRLELYFFGEAKTWGDITQTIRTKLITSATTQINRDDPRYALSPELRQLSPEIFTFLEDSVNRLSKLRLGKGGKKSYDHLVSGYFNDMLLVLKDVYRVLKPTRKAVFVLGDSAPYGVHIPTDELIGKIGLAIGFHSYSIDVLRTRGGKWKDNPQRHDVQLRESIVTLMKG